jgi:transcription elongation GreA/GreB family factor
LSAHDQKILRSLVEVVHGGSSADATFDSTVVWVSEQGYRKAKERIQHIGTIEIVDNAKEIEVARAHGDLRENAEFKCALERRARLQNELKVLSDQFNRARILTPEDISTDCVGIGTRVTLQNKIGHVDTFTILGPWDANAESNIISMQSKVAQALLGKKEGNSFEFRGETVIIQKIESYLAPNLG